MTRIHLLLADSNERYITRLAEYIAAEYSAKFMVSCFTRMSMLKEYIEKNNGAGFMLLAGKEFYNGLYSESSDAGPIMTVILTDDMNEEDFKGKHCIFRFQSAGKIVSQCIDLYAGGAGTGYACGDDAGREDLYMPVQIREGRQGSCVRRGRTEIISAISPLGGSGRTLILYALACILSRAGQKVIFISLESIPTLECLTGTECGRYGLSEVVLGMKKKDRNIPLLIDKYREAGNDGFDHIRSVECLLDIDELELPELRELLGSIRMGGRYDFAVIDCDHKLTGRALAVLEASSAIFTVFCGAPTEKYRYGRIVRQMRNMTCYENERMESRQIYLMNHCRMGVTAVETEGLDIPVSGLPELPYCEDVVQNTGSGCRINTGSAFCKTLADIISDRKVFRDRIMKMVK